MRRVGPDELVPARRADQQLPVKARAQAARRLRAGRGVVARTHLRILALPAVDEAKREWAMRDAVGSPGGWPARLQALAAHVAG
jgi:hypothetical protein